MNLNSIFGESIVLHELEEKHASETYLSWMQDPEVNQYLESRLQTHTLDSLKYYISGMRGSTDSFLFGIFTLDGVHRGNIKLGPVSEVHLSAPIGIIIGDKTVWGRGIASEAIGLLTSWAFQELQLEKVWAGAYAANMGSVRAFEHNGFEVEGVQKSHVTLASGERGDLILVGRVRP